MHRKRASIGTVLAVMFLLGVIGGMAWLWYQYNRTALVAVFEHAQKPYADENNLALLVTNSIGMELVLIPPGEFDMGSADDEPGRSVYEARHTVHIPHAFYMSTTEITQGAFETVMSNNPSQFQDIALRPVDRVTRDEVIEFCNRLSQREGLGEAYQQTDDGVVCHIDRPGYRLPVEAEWEYACRAGTLEAFYTGPVHPLSDAPKHLGTAAWYLKNSRGGSQNVGQRRPNPWGLFDMLGNAWEWCWDWFAAYPVTQVSLLGPEKGIQGYAIRGGGWYSPLEECRAASRKGWLPDDRWNVLGFRCVRTVPSSPAKDQ